MPPACPARLALLNAIELNRQRGDEVRGPLSEQHGFLPREAPLLELPLSHRSWDDVAARLPELHRGLELRSVVEAMPLLDATSEQLPDVYLLRASVMLTMVAHSYYHIDRPTQLPRCVLEPWDEVNRRLAKPARSMSVMDLVAYNWRMVDPGRPDPMRVENLVPLCQTMGSQAQVVSWMTLVEALAQSARLIGTAVRAQEAVQGDDRDAVERELVGLAECVQDLTFTTFAKTDPNPYSPTYVDPLVWSRTVVTVASAIEPGVDQGPAGTGMPLFHTLDILLGRDDYGSALGREMLRIRKGFPANWQAFLTALAHMSITGYVAKKADRRLSGALRSALQSYAGEHGLLGRHRLKAFGYIDVGSRAGRTVTVAGFSGQRAEPIGDTTDRELELARRERARRAGDVAYVASAVPHYARRSDDGSLLRVVLDIQGLGVRYRPGDRCAVLPRNDPSLVAKTLAVFGAHGDEPVVLDSLWQTALAERGVDRPRPALPLRELLRLGQIRPVNRAVAKALYAVTYNERLRVLIEGRTEDQWELWELVEWLVEAGFQPRRLWQAPPGAAENICRIVPPERARFYSISSTMKTEPDELHLTVGKLVYRSEADGPRVGADRLGTASGFLSRSANGSREPVAFHIVPAARFRLPDSATPVIMVAGGTGISPFRALLHARAGDPSAGPTWLFYGIRSKQDFHYGDELSQLVGKGRLQLRVAFSREDVTTTGIPGADGRPVFLKGRRHRITEEMLDEDNAQAIRELLAERGGGSQPGCIYVCGRSDFASSVMGAFSSVLRSSGSQAASHPGELTTNGLSRLVGRGRYRQEVFTSYTGRARADALPDWDASEIARHRDADTGYWMVISGEVYDVTDFAHIHPGGLQVVQGYVGLDATNAYERAQHHLSPEANAMLGMYHIGRVRRLRFGTAWGVAIGDDGLRSVLVSDLYRVWARLLYEASELANSLDIDFGLRRAATTRGEPPDDITPFNLRTTIAAHERFLAYCRSGPLTESLHALWAMTTGVCGAGAPVNWMREALRSAHGSSAASDGQAHIVRLSSIVMGDDRAPPSQHQQRLSRLASLCDIVESLDRHLVNRLSHALCQGVVVFEDLEGAAASDGGQRLVAAAEAIPALLSEYYTRMRDQVRLDNDPEGRP